MIYLDSASTTQPDTRVVESMMRYLLWDYGNPSTRYKLGMTSKNAIEDARVKVADFLDANPEDIIFTSGGSEANNLMINMISKWCYDRMKSGEKIVKIMVSDLEHDSILRAVKLMPKFIKVMKIPVLKTGCVDINFIAGNAKYCEACIVMGANNETGVMNNIKLISKICHNNNCKFATDCVQLAGCVDISVKNIGCDLMSISSHKIYGCKGAGALYVKDLEHTSLPKPVIVGGEFQEKGWRSGTENVPAIVGFGTACDLIMNEKRSMSDIYCELKTEFIDRFELRLKDLGILEKVNFNGDANRNCNKTVSITVDGVDSESLVLYLSEIKDICISSGSACHSNSSQPSKSLLAMGLSKDKARSTIRVSFSKYLTIADVAEAAYSIADAIKYMLDLSSINLTDEINPEENDDSD